MSKIFKSTSKILNEMQKLSSWPKKNYNRKSRQSSYFRDRQNNQRCIDNRSRGNSSPFYFRQHDFTPYENRNNQRLDKHDRNFQSRRERQMEKNLVDIDTMNRFSVLKAGDTL